MKENLEELEQKEVNNTVKKRWIGKGIYGSKDAPIRVLDGLIAGIFAVIIVLVIVFAINGGFYVRYETDGGSEIEAEKLRYGDLATEPVRPIKAGYDFKGWITSEDPSLAEEWDFARDKVEGDMTLYAVWEPAQITVKFDLDGGSIAGRESAEDIKVTFGEPYGSNLPVPEKEGCQFDGWMYSGNIIQADTLVSTSGEHVLTARWILK